MFLASWFIAVTGWHQHGGVNCYHGRGGTEIDHDPIGSNLTLEECQQQCEATIDCVGIVRKVADVRWTAHSDANCYDGAGAKSVRLPSAPNTHVCYSTTLDECQTQCLLADGCTGIVWHTSDGACCARSDINISQCETGGGYATYELTIYARHPERGECWRRSGIDIAHCDAEHDDYDTHVLHPAAPAEPWWLTTNFAERAVMPRRYACREGSPPPGICTLQDLRKLLPSLRASGYSVLNVDWPVHAGPDALYEGFGIHNATAIDPLLGSDADWAALVDDAHSHGMKVVADFNPSYFHTGSPYFRQAVHDVAAHGLDDLPAASPARWFRWAPSCPGALEQPPDEYAHLNGMTDGWVHSEAANACYFAVFGGDGVYGGQPTADLASAAWRTEITRIFTHWASERGLDGFMLDAPRWYLNSEVGSHDGMHDQGVATRLRELVVEPMHKLGAAVFGEMYNLAGPPYSNPTVLKMLDGGRNTDMPVDEQQPDGVAGFPGLLHRMVLAQNASGLEHLLRSTVDVWARWCGTPRTEPHSRGPAAIAGLKAAVTALTAGYYVVRMGPNCTSPFGPGYGPSPPGDEWPGGCFGEWLGAPLVAATLKALPASAALRPGTARRPLRVISTSGCGQRSCAYAALRTNGGHRQHAAAAAAVVIFNFADAAAEFTIEPLGPYGVVGADSIDLIHGGYGPAIHPEEPWVVALPPRGWAAFGVHVADTSV